MWSDPNESPRNQSPHRSLRSLKKTSPPLGQSAASLPAYHSSHHFSDSTKRVYHKLPLTHYRSSPPQIESPTHRNIALSPVSSCDSPTLVRHFSEDSNHNIRRIRLIKSTDDDPSAGITLCGGPEVGLQGIYISRIQEDSLAEKCGLRPGDQILSTNYTSFMDGITCKQAFRIICENDCLLFNICPRHEEHTLQRKHHSYAWINADGRPTTTLIDEPSLMDRQINSINTSPFQRKSPIDEFELSRSDNMMSPQSVPNSSAAYRRAMMLRRHSSSASEAPLMDTTNETNNATPDERRWSIAAHEVPQDYQHVGINYDNYGEDGRTRSPVPTNMMMTLGAATGDIRGSGNHLRVPGDAGTEPPGPFLNIHSRIRRHRSLPSPTFSNPKALPPPQQQRSSSFRLPTHRGIREQNGQWRISVKKSKPILGIAIEGGVNVPSQTQPRIISIHSSGAAIECGDLHVGHIILEVDGRTTESLNHDQVAQMIANAYYNTPHKDFIEFLVREKLKNEFDLRRSSFMLLNNSFE